MDSKRNDQLAVGGAVVLFVGLVLQFMKLEWAPYVYLVGACLFAYVQLVSDYKGSNVVIRRLRRQQLLGAMLLVLTGVVMLLRLYWNCIRLSGFHRKKQRKNNTEKW